MGIRGEVSGFNDRRMAAGDDFSLHLRGQALGIRGGKRKALLPEGSMESSGILVGILPSDVKREKGS